MIPWTAKKQSQEEKMEVDGRGKLMGWREWALVIATIVVLLIAAAILSEGFRCFIASSVTAAWVQAIGSILAIASAIWISWRQLAEQKKDTETVIRSKLLGAMSLLGESVASLRHTVMLVEIVSPAGAVQMPVDHQRSLVASMKTLSRSIKSVEKIPFHEYPYSSVHHALNPILSGLYDVDVVMETLIEKLQIFPQVKMDDFSVNRLRESAEMVADEYQALRASGKIDPSLFPEPFYMVGAE